MSTFANIAKTARKQLTLVYLDVTKAYDKAWLKAVMYSASNRGLEGHTWLIVKELNSNLKAVIRTKHGLTREISMNEVLKEPPL